MISNYVFKFDNTSENVDKFYEPLKGFAFDFPFPSGSFHSESFFKIPEQIDTYTTRETYVSVSYSSKIGEGTRNVRIQTSVEPNKPGRERFDSRLIDILKSVNAEEIKSE